jgi:hypothetical protein
LYELPFGRGRQFLGNVNRATDLLVGGWQWNSALTFGTGLPWSPSYTNCNLDRDTGPCRPDLTGSFHYGIHQQGTTVTYFTPTTTQLCDVAASCPGGVVTSAGPFGDPGVGNFGNIQRNAFTGPGEIKADMSFFKNFPITEQVRAQFQAEFFNIFNHPVYAFNVNQTGSGTNIDSAGAGQINSLESDVPMRQFQLGVRVTF